MKTRDEFNKWYDEHMIVMLPDSMTPEQQDAFNTKMRDKAFDKLVARTVLDLRTT